MRRHSIHILCIQETRKKLSDSFVTFFGCSVYLSGGSDDSPEWAGVGFVCSPSILQSLIGFTPFSNGVASLSLHVAGGSCASLSAHAPHNLKDLADRFAFDESLDSHLRRLAVNGKKHIVGDFNARISQRRLGEEHSLGSHCRHGTQ